MNNSKNLDSRTKPICYCYPIKQNYVVERPLLLETEWYRSYGTIFIHGYNHDLDFWNGKTEKKNKHNSPIYDEYQTQSAKVLTLLWELAHQDDSNDTPQPICEYQVDFS